MAWRRTATTTNWLRIRALRGCSMVFVVDVDSGRRGRVGHARVVPMRAYAGKPIVNALDALRDGLRRNPAAGCGASSKGPSQ